ncbi:hypothetical protein NUW58_g7745 [Xylaria curta]|uniref:Uncharacterized protein n=1 Tax=Xylaria curta TaxID=42375 RepID=A0ACC1NGL0_9PEZI|nr:hypothetical protein NUW58_g7745 [Xylaria curta]
MYPALELSGAQILQFSGPRRSSLVLHSPIPNRVGCAMRDVVPQRLACTGHVPSHFELRSHTCTYLTAFLVRFCLCLWLCVYLPVCPSPIALGNQRKGNHPPVQALTLGLSSHSLDFLAADSHTTSIPTPLLFLDYYFSTLALNPVTAVQCISSSSAHFQFSSYTQPLSLPHTSSMFLEASGRTSADPFLTQAAARPVLTGC